MDANPETRRKRLENGLKWGGGLLGVIILGFLTPYILSGIMGGAALFAAGVIGYVGLQLWPVFATKLANVRMKMLVAEVEANPIETMRNLYAEKQQELQGADDNIVAFEMEVRSFNDQLTGFKEQYPDEAHTYQDISDKMGQALQDMKAEQTAARRELGNFSAKIKKGEAIWKMALAANKVVSLSKSAEATVFAQIKEQIAFDSVRDQLNRSFANLSLAVERRTDARAFKPVATVEVVAPRRITEGVPTTDLSAGIREPERVKVQR